MRSLKKSASFLLRSQEEIFVSTDLKTIPGDIFTLSSCGCTSENWMINDFWRLGIQKEDPENILRAQKHEVKTIKFLKTHQIQCRLFQQGAALYFLRHLLTMGHKHNWNKSANIVRLLHQVCRNSPQFRWSTHNLWYVCYKSKRKKDIVKSP